MLCGTPVVGADANPSASCLDMMLANCWAGSDARVVKPSAEFEIRKMTPELKTYVEAWREVSPILEAMRDEELRNTPLPLAMAQLSSMIDSAIFLKPLSDTSGLVEMQRIFSRIR